MKNNFKVGYVPYSPDLSHPGDRRRIATWANASSNDLILNSPLDSDIIILSANANFARWIKKAQQPVVLDLVDGYMGENPSFLRDFGRNILRSCQGKSNFLAITFTRAIRRACIEAAAVVVASPEQAKEIMPFNSNIYVILDDHSELDSAKYIRHENSSDKQNSKYIFWEGFGYTVKHFKFISKNLDEFMHKSGYKLLLLTNPKFARWGSNIGKIDTKTLISKWFPKSKDQVQVLPWTINNVINSAAKSDFALIPIDTEDRFANLKPENKLLSMWHLGLPTLFSNTLAYKRVAKEVGVTNLCIDKLDWEETFRNFDLSVLRNSYAKSDEYISFFHSRDFLVERWQILFTEVLELHG